MNLKQKEAFCHITSGKNVCVTGQAGTGKTFILNQLLKWGIENKKKIAFTASTGIAAILIKGTTLHRWAGIKKGDGTVDYLVSMISSNKGALSRWKTTHILVIDEMSMLGLEIFEKMNAIGQIIRGNDKPFGGIQMVLCGDFLQLPPIKDNFLFESYVWQYITNIVYLTENMRQSGEGFQKALEEIRLGIVTPQTEKMFNDRIKKVTGNKFGIRPTKLYSRRDSVDVENNKRLSKLPGDRKVYKSNIQFISDKQISINTKNILTQVISRDCPAVDTLTLAVGAQVMLLRNLFPELELVNGSRGVITKLHEDGPEVVFLNGTKMIIESEQWDVTINKVTVVKHQIPLQLAFASTIHRCQGATLDYVAADAGPTIFEDGQVYVVLSRVRNIEGLCLMNFDPKKIRANKKALEFYNTLG